MHFEILVEDRSGQKALDILVPNIIGAQDTFRKVRIEFGGEVEPDEEKVERINDLLSEALEELRLGRGSLPRQ